MSSTKNQFAVRFDPPENGCIRVEIDTGDQKFLEWFSYTPNDFIHDLASALALFAKGNTDANAVGFTEPITYEFQFCELPDEQVVAMEITQYPNWNHAKRDAKRMFHYKASRRELCLVFGERCDGLKRR